MKIILGGFATAVLLSWGLMAWAGNSPAEQPTTPTLMNYSNATKPKTARDMATAGMVSSSLTSNTLHGAPPVRPYQKQPSKKN